MLGDFGTFTLLNYIAILVLTTDLSIQLRCRDAAMGLKLPGLDAKAKKEDYEDFNTRFEKILHSCKVRSGCQFLH
jgi:hypothetical protein